MYDHGARLFVEVGPKGVLSGLSRQILEGHPARILQTDMSERHGIVQLLHVLAQLAVSGVAIDMDQLFRGRVGQPLPLSQLATKPVEPAWLVNGGRAFARAQRPEPVVPVKVAQPIVAACPCSRSCGSTCYARPSTSSCYRFGNAAVPAAHVAIPADAGDRDDGLLARDAGGGAAFRSLTVAAQKQWRCYQRQRWYRRHQCYQRQRRYPRQQ